MAAKRRSRYAFSAFSFFFWGGFSFPFFWAIFLRGVRIFCDERSVAFFEFGSFRNGDANTEAIVHAGGNSVKAFFRFQKEKKRIERNIKNCCKSAGARVV